MENQGRFLKRIRRSGRAETTPSEESFELDGVDPGVILELAHASESKKDDEIKALEEYINSLNEKDRSFTVESQIAEQLTSIRRLCNEIGRKQVDFFASRVGHKAVKAYLLRQHPIRTPRQETPFHIKKRGSSSPSGVLDGVMGRRARQVAIDMGKIYAPDKNIWIKVFPTVPNMEYVHHDEVWHWSSPPVVLETQQTDLNEDIISLGWKVQGYGDGYAAYHCLTANDETHEKLKYYISNEGEVTRQDSKATELNDKYFALGLVQRSTDALNDRLKLVSQRPRRIRKMYGYASMAKPLDEISRVAHNRI
jgi:hypothetical protein